ncbi:MAG: hypothetical protein EXS09_18200 [Gemmataceae bacterium]|nr:hypothetical protein [Gemmataceae bacterium]
MSRYAFLVFVVLGTTANADAPRFKFEKGETLTYHIVQTTSINEIVLEEKTDKPIESATTTKVDLIRKWKVVDVDAKGTATLEMTIASMRLERKTGTDEDIFDSTKPDSLNKHEMTKHIGPVLAILRIDVQGKLVEVKESKVGPATRFASELPFKLTLPDNEPKQGDSWERSYSIQLDPPLGTGEKYLATQKYACQEPKGGLLSVTLTTSIKALPAQGFDQIPLLPSMSEGTLYFYASTGRYYAARLKTQKELKNHQGEGSSYSYTSSYVEDLVTEK